LNLAEINFSVIADTPDETEILAGFLKIFEEKRGQQVRLQSMKWSEAWPILLANALHGSGPAVSHVGSTWSTSLGAMNTLRPFSEKEVAVLGGPDKFFPAVWQSTSLEGDSTVWSIPWTSYTYLISYRSDRLERIGLNPGTAFRTPEAMAETLARLQSLGMEYPWVIPTETHYADLIHIASSFVWGAGGDFVSQDRKKILVCQPESCSGLVDFFELYRYLPLQSKGLTYQQCIRLFAEGRVGVFITGAEVPSIVSKAPDTAPRVRSSIQTAPLPGVPWVGGDNLVIWRHARGDPGQETAALALVDFLVDPDVQLAFCQAQNTLPVRPGVLAQLSFWPETLRQSVETALLNGRSHCSVSLWRVVEYRIGQGLDAIAAELLNDRAADIKALVDKHLMPVVHRLELTLEQ